jgi:hypothetical protein
MKILKFDHKPTEDEILDRVPDAENKTARIVLLKNNTYAVLIFD